MPQIIKKPVTNVNSGNFSTHFTTQIFDFTILYEEYLTVNAL